MNNKDYKMTFFPESDKQGRMIASAIVANIFYTLTSDPIGSFFIMVGVGLIKELTDTNTMREHVRDMLANIIGASTVLLWLL